jgi:hypothetical protein
MARTVRGLDRIAGLQVQIEQVERDLLECRTGSTARVELLKLRRGLTADVAEAEAALPRPKARGAADMSVDEYRAQLEAAARDCTLAELEVFAAELLRRYGYHLRADAEHGTLNLEGIQ